MTKLALELKEVRKSFGPAEIIRGANLQVPQGERFAVIGPNGAGKSTLFNLMSGRFPVTSGEIHLHGQRIDALSPQEIYRQGLARSFQITNIFPKLTVYENLMCAVLWSKGHRYTFLRRLTQLKDVNERAQEVLELIGLQSRRYVKGGLLTYAEQRALEIGLTVAGTADVILLDEPTADRVTRCLSVFEHHVHAKVTCTRSCSGLVSFSRWVGRTRTFHLHLPDAVAVNMQAPYQAELIQRSLNGGFQAVAAF